MKLYYSFFTILICLAYVPFRAGAEDIKLFVTNSVAADRIGEAITTGIPFPEGVVKDTGLLNVAIGNHVIPSQFTPIIAWSDGSVRWALLDTQIDITAHEERELSLSYGNKTHKTINPINIIENESSISLSSGGLLLRINKKLFNLIESLKIDGHEVITPQSRGLVIYLEDGTEVRAGPPTGVHVETVGPMRATVCLRGRFPDIHKNLLGYTVRITVFAGQKYLKIHTWLENDGGLTQRAPGKAEWFAFDGMAIDFGLNLGTEIVAESEGAKSTNTFRIAQYADPNHDWKSFNYRITDEENLLKEGDRTDGVVALKGNSSSTTVAVCHFWENYEKAIELDAPSLKVWLWPTDGEWPRSKAKRGKDSQNEYRQFRNAGLYHLPGGTRKGHELILDFSGRDVNATHATVAYPLLAVAESSYYAHTEAVNGWMAPADFTTGNDSYDEAVAIWNRIATQAVDADDKRGSIVAARRGVADHRGFWHGWMDFGDLLWAEGYCSLHYDWTWVMMLNFLRTGDRRFYDMGVTMARHRTDIDQIWTGDSRYYNNLTRYEKSYTSIHGGLNDGHYGPVPSHNWIGGIVLSYMITGENHYRECALNNYEGMKRRLIEPQDKKPDTSVQTRDLGWTILNLCSLFDMTAEQKYLDDAMTLFNKPMTMQWQERGPYFGTSGGSCLQFYYSTQGICELHHRTGDPNILKLIKEGCKGDYESTNPVYDEWHIFLSNYYAYLGYIEKNTDYLDKAETLFNIYLTSQKNKSCYDNTGAWTKSSAKLLRNGHILQYVKWKIKYASN